MDEKGLIYLATPYTCRGSKAQVVKDRIEGKRFRIVTEISILMFKKGLIFFSPITQGHAQRQIAKNMGIDMAEGWKLWKKFDFGFLKFCTALYVAKIPGWDTSVGVLAELEEAKRLGLPVHFVMYDEEKQTIKVELEKRKIQ